MANFRGHLYGGMAVSAAAGLGVEHLGWVHPSYTLVLFGLGVVGGLLPDIDADNSIPVRLLFNLLGAVTAFLVGLSLHGRIEPLALAVLLVLVFLLVRFGLFEIFCRFTVHRGVWHSWLAAAFVALATADAAYHLAGVPVWESWLAGGFVILGYLTHLTLDEIAGVDLLNRRLKSSFGTALKPFSCAAPIASTLMLLGTLALAYLAPTIAPVVRVVSELSLG